MRKRHPISGLLPPEWCKELTVKGHKSVVMEVPLKAIEDDTLWNIVQEGKYDIRWPWAGIAQDAWDEFRLRGDTTARKRAEEHGAGAVMDQQMRATVSRRMPVRSVMGAVVVPAALAGHPLACIKPGSNSTKVDRFWINLSAPSHEDAASFWKRCTESLAKAVAASRHKPIEVVPYVAADDGWGYELGTKSTVVYAMYTRIVINPYSWTRLGQVLHPSMLRVLMLGALQAMSQNGLVGNGGHATWTSDGGLKQLRTAGVDPDTWFERGGLRHA